MKRFYEIIYRYFRAPWDSGARDELVSLVQSERIHRGCAIDLGCGTGTNAIFLAQHGFKVTGVDFAKAAIEKARKRADDGGVQVNFIVDDLTKLINVSGKYDFLLDYGVLDDLRPRQREPYLRSILALTHPGSQYLLWGFEYPIRWWEKLIPFFDIPFYPEEINQLFSPYFEIEKIGGKVDYSTWPPGYAAYLMTRKIGSL